MLFKFCCEETFREGTGFLFSFSSRVRPHLLKRGYPDSFFERMRKEVAGTRAAMKAANVTLEAVKGKFENVASAKAARELVFSKLPKVKIRVHSGCEPRISRFTAAVNRDFTSSQPPRCALWETSEFAAKS